MKKINFKSELAKKAMIIVVLMALAIFGVSQTVTKLAVPAGLQTSKCYSYGNECFVAGGTGYLGYYLNNVGSVENNPGGHLRSIAGVGNTKVLAVGDNGVLIKRVGGVWIYITTSITENLNVIGAGKDGSFFIGGGNGNLYTTDGVTTFTNIGNVGTFMITGLYVQDATHVYILCSGADWEIKFFDGSTISVLKSGITAGLNGICPTQDPNVFDVGTADGLYSFNKSTGDFTLIRNVGSFYGIGCSLKSDNSERMFGGPGVAQAGLLEQYNGVWSNLGNYNVNQVYSEPDSKRAYAVGDDGLLYIDLTTGVDEKESIGNFKMFPNPCTDKAVIDLSSIKNSSKMNVELFNLTGQKIMTVFEGKNLENNLEINTSELPIGIYLIRITSEEKIYLERLVKN